MRVAEEEDRRLLMLASDGCFRFMMDVERLSTKGEEQRQTREVGFTLEASLRGRVLECIWRNTRFSVMLMVICTVIYTPNESN